MGGWIIYTPFIMYMCDIPISHNQSNKRQEYVLLNVTHNSVTSSVSLTISFPFFCTLSQSLFHHIQFLAHHYHSNFSYSVSYSMSALCSTHLQVSPTVAPHVVCPDENPAFVDQFRWWTELLDVYSWCAINVFWPWCC